MTEQDLFCYEHPRPALTVDIVLLREKRATQRAGTRRRATELEVLLIQRGRAPFEGAWALPGGFVEQGEAPEEAARRELAEETGASGDCLTQIGAFGAPGRDPRGWVVSIAYWASGEASGSSPTPGDDAARARWWAVDALPPLAFDHAEIITQALRATLT